LKCPSPETVRYFKFENDADDFWRMIVIDKTDNGHQIRSNPVSAYANSAVAFKYLMDDQEMPPKSDTTAFGELVTIY
jgi:hypothetical protein